MATAAVQVMLGGKGAGLMAAAIMVSTFGCTNGMVMAGARVYYAMAKDGLFFPSVGKINPKYHTPAVSLMVQAVWAAILTLTGTYNELLDYVIFAVVLFLYFDHRGHLPPAANAPGSAAALSSLGLSRPSPAVYCFCLICGVGFADPQNLAEFCRFEYRRHRHSGLLFLATVAEPRALREM